VSHRQVPGRHGRPGLPRMRGRTIRQRIRNELVGMVRTAGLIAALLLLALLTLPSAILPC